MRRLLAATAILLVGCSPEPEPAADAGQAAAGFTGSEQCRSCHETEFEAWRGSHHQLAMQEATAGSVLGDFSGVTVPWFDSQAVFATRDGSFYAILDNASGEQQEFEITHTFGITPLQQYLVDGPGGRKQALQYAWDSRPENEGGQRWYHLYPDDYAPPGDVLHWTGRYFTWNTMCAECHSTNLAVNYDPVTDSFATTWDEISVGCEACHGPGSEHIRQAQFASFDEHYGLPVSLDDRHGGAWVMNTETGIAELGEPGAQQQVESCGRCHARRAVLTNEYGYGKPLTDTHMPSLLDEHLYHADGRIQDEVYVYGSFLQSKMYAVGVTCSDCHEPHSATLRAGPDPNDTCALCHLPDTFATTEHSATDTGDCVSCHMPATTYMVVDPRRDHSFRVPGTSDDPDHYGAAIAAGRAGAADDELLTAIASETYPAIARATMLTLFERPDGALQFAVLTEQLNDPSPLVRIAALRALQTLPLRARGTTGSALLADPVRAVRIEAARALLSERDLLDYDGAKALDAATAELRESLEASQFWPESAMQLGELESQLGNVAAARQYYERALQLDPQFAPGHHAFGLFLVRANQQETALRHLAEATQLAPDVPRYAYVYGVALNSFGEAERAIALLRDARERFPDDYNIGFALATILRDNGQTDEFERIMLELQDR